MDEVVVAVMAVVMIGAAIGGWRIERKQKNQIIQKMEENRYEPVDVDISNYWRSGRSRKYVVYFIFIYCSSGI